MAEEKIVAAVEETVAKKKAPAKKAAAKPAAEKVAKPAAEKVAKEVEPVAKKKAPAKVVSADKVTIKLVKSLIGRGRIQIATANSLGLKKVGDVTVQPDNVATTGKINRISHLVMVIKA